MSQPWTKEPSTLKPLLSAEQQASLAGLLVRCQEREHVPGYTAICVDCLKTYLVNSGWGGCAGLNPAGVRACVEALEETTVVVKLVCRLIVQHGLTDELPPGFDGFGVRAQQALAAVRQGQEAGGGILRITAEGLHE